MAPFGDNLYNDEYYTSPMGIIALSGATEMGKKIDSFLTDWYNSDTEKEKIKRTKKETFLIDASYPRFTTGDGKAIINDTVRGKDLYIIADVGNHGETYNMFGFDRPKSPDEHFADLKRIISAAGGKPSRITVIMPILYGGRQHRRNSRESLDCAMMLQELEAMGVKDIITFDAHDPGFKTLFRLWVLITFSYIPNFKAMTRIFPAFNL